MSDEHSRARDMVDGKSDEYLDMVRAYYEDAYRERVRAWLRAEAARVGPSGHASFVEELADNLP